MSVDTLTFELTGEVSLTKFAEAMKCFQALIADLSTDMSDGGAVTWQIEDLGKGSAIATIQGSGPNPETVERIVRAYNEIGRSLESRTPIPYSDRIKRRATALAKLIDGGVTALRFETPFGDAIVGRQTDTPPNTPSITYAYGAVQGIVETLTIRRGLRFTLYDSIFDRPISCYLQEGQEEDMRDAWGHRVVVSGLIGREPETKRPVVVRDIQQIEILVDVVPGSYRQARGVLASSPDSPRSEVIIRGIRDAD